MPFLKPCVVLPTYNEKENISRMVPALFALSLPNLQVLVVDDSSPDGTGEEVRRLQSQYPRLFLLTRARKEGLGRAYVAGFQKAMEMGADAILQMDADFSHNPDDIPRFLEALDGADLVIGSRYVPGGKTENWPWHRYLLSWGANLYARSILGMFIVGARVAPSSGKAAGASPSAPFGLCESPESTPVFRRGRFTRSRGVNPRSLKSRGSFWCSTLTTPIRDLTGGFKAWRRDSLARIGLDTLRTNGYGFQIETTFRAIKKGCKAVERPIVFSERRAGQSKMSRKIIWEALWLVWKLRFAK